MSNSNKNTIIMPDANKAPLHTGNIIAWMWYFLSPYKNIVIGFSIYRLIRNTYFSIMPLVIGWMINLLESGTAQEDPIFYASILIGYIIGFAIFVYNMIFIPEVREYEKAIRGLTLYGIKHLNALSID